MFLRLLFINPIENFISSMDFFILFSLIFLVWYLKYLEFPNKIKVSAQKELLDNPIYQSKDVLLQGSVSDIDYIPTGKLKSIWVKLVLVFFAFIIIITPLYKLLGINYFL